MKINCIAAAPSQNYNRVTCKDGRFGGASRLSITTVAPEQCARCSNRKPIYSDRPVILTMETELPRSEWPAKTALIVKRARIEDKGLGDTVHRLLLDSVIQKIANLIPNCGCSERRIKWNKRYPYLPEYFDQFGNWRV